MEGFIGQVIMFAGNFAPKDFAFCQGQSMAVSQNTALYSILGTTYGGNGTTTFVLPDTRGRVVVGAGQGPGLSNYSLGQMGGSTLTTITAEQMPAHTHGIAATSMIHCNENLSDNVSPTGEFWGPTEGTNTYGTLTDTAMAADAVTVNITLANSGGSQPFDNSQPYLGMNYVVCMYGIFPSRN
jgi:microcystin-dependent protein